MTALRNTPVALLRMPLRSRSVPSELRTSSRVKRCSMPAWRKPPSAHLPAPARRTRARRRHCPVGGAAGPAGRNAAVVARQRRGQAGAGAGPAGGRSGVPEARDRRGADEPGAGGGRGARHGASSCSATHPIMPASASPVARTGELSLPGPFERDRLLGLELREGALDGAWGMIAPAGAAAAEQPARRARTLRSAPRAA